MVFRAKWISIILIDCDKIEEQSQNESLCVLFDVVLNDIYGRIAYCNQLQTAID